MKWTFIDQQLANNKQTSTRILSMSIVYNFTEQQQQQWENEVMSHLNLLWLPASRL